MTPPSTILTLGLGGSPSLVLTLGYGAGAAAEVERPHYALCLHGRDHRRVVLSGADHRRVRVEGRRRADEC